MTTTIHISHCELFATTKKAAQRYENSGKKSRLHLQKKYKYAIYNQIVVCFKIQNRLFFISKEPILQFKTGTFEILLVFKPRRVRSLSHR